MSLLEGLLAYYKFDENAGTLVGDSAGGNTGTTQGTNVWTSSGQINSATRFDRSTNFIQFGNPQRISNTGAANFSVFSWIMTSTTGTRQSIFSAGTGGINTNKGLFLYVNSGNNIAFDLNNAAGPTGGSVTGTIFHYVGVTSRGGTIQLYLDGTTSGATSAMSPNISSGGVTVGTSLPGDATPFLFAGTIDELGYWNKALSAGEVTSLYNAGAGLQFSFGSGPYRRRGIGN